jgi:dUTP pyrophosphatase
MFGLKLKKKIMSNINLEELLSKLKDVESTITNDDDDSTSFIKDLDDIMNMLNPKSDVLNVKIKKLHKDAVTPSYSKDGDAGMDLTCVDIEYQQDYVSYKIGLSFEIPKGYVGLLFPRSSNSKKDLLLTNSVGVIDSGYRGEVELRFKPILNGKLENIKTYEVGDRIGQIMIIPYPKIEFVETENLSQSQRGDGGFGSTGL